MRKQTERIERLPKWAQQKIKVLESNLEDLRERMKGVENKTSGISYSPNWDLNYYLPEHSRITFTFDKYDIDVYKGQDSEGLTITGDCRIVIHPNSSNQIKVLLEKK